MNDQFERWAMGFMVVADDGSAYRVPHTAICRTDHDVVTQSDQAIARAAMTSYVEHARDRNRYE